MEETLDIAEVCKDIEDHLVPYVRLRAFERALYYHLLRHSRFVGQRDLRISARPLARVSAISHSTIKVVLRHLARKGCLKIVERSPHGYRLEIFVPAEIPGCVRPQPATCAIDLEAADCFRSPELRAAVRQREEQLCFYCLRDIGGGAGVLDHVVPLAEGGDNSYRNVVACCQECNASKSDQPAADFLRSLYRRNRLTEAEFDARLAALEAVQRGSLKPSLPAPDRP